MFVACSISEAWNYHAYFSYALQTVLISTRCILQSESRSRIHVTCDMRRMGPIDGRNPATNGKFEADHGFV